MTQTLRRGHDDYTGGVGKTGEVVVVGSVCVSKHTGGYPYTGHTQRGA